jgi:dihydrofolate reductase
MGADQTDNHVPVVLVLAASDDGVIGKGNALPWELPDDLLHFKRTTMGRPVVMGRKTFDSVGFPLPGRRNIVITRDREWSHAGVLTCHTLDDALERAFEQADKAVVTRVHGDVAGDVRFDLKAFENWREVASRRYEAEGGNSHAFTIVELEAP